MAQGDRVFDEPIHNNVCGYVVGAPARPSNLTSGVGMRSRASVEFNCAMGYARSVRAPVPRINVTDPQERVPTDLGLIIVALDNWV
jgi:hypothetical protein